MKILLDKTDEEHTITVPQMIEELVNMGISAERKSIYDDLEYLKLFGIDIVCQKSKTHDYFVASRDFELPELKLLVDSVQSSKFITHKKSLELIHKIENLTSHNNARKLQRQVFVSNRVKTMNESIYYNVDAIHEAIAQNKQIIFRYFEWTLDKKKQFRKNGDKYIETPVSLTWDDENYYLITYKEKYGGFTHYRVDKMSNIEIVDADRVMPQEEFDLAKYSKTMFSMFGGEETEVSVRFKNFLIGAVIDRFGNDVPIIKSDDEHFIAQIKVAASPHFLSWVIGFGSNAKIISPEWVIDNIYDLACETTKQYEEEKK